MMTIQARPTSTPQARRAAAASFFGSMLEFYEFFIYATAAALVFSTIMFPPDTGAGALLSLATFGVAYLARPFGAILFGQIGDTLGRKRTLILSLVMMGCSTVLIGCIPTYQDIGIAAPIILVILRIVQGISAAGEAAGAASLVVEQAPEGRRGLFGSSVTTGVAVGFILASLVFLPVAALPREALLSWGWRVPFWLSAVILVIAYIVRRRIEEPAIFEETREHGRTAKLPVVAVVRDRWQDIVRVTAATFFIAIQSLLTVFGLGYVTTATDIPATAMLWIWIVAYAVSVVLQPLAGLLSDRWGRKPVFIFGCVGMAVSVVFFFGVVSTASVLLIGLAGVLTLGVFYSFANGVYPAFFPEMFDVRVRYSGYAISLQLGLIVTGFAPAIAVTLVGLAQPSWLLPALLGSAFAVIAGVAVLTARETAHTPLRELGQTPSPRTAEKEATR